MKRKLTLLFLCLLPVSLLRAQNVADLILSEAMPDGDSTSVIDAYGRHGGWVEVFNTSQGTVNFGGCFVSDDRADLRKNLIPKGDLRTLVGPRQTALFFASGNGSQGPLYLNFRIRPGSTLYLTSNDGRTLIDSLVIPGDLPAGKSVARFARDLRGMEFHGSDTVSEPTPGVANGNPDAETRSQKMAREDPHGWILSLVSVLVVFTALAILWFLFNLIFDRPARRQRRRKTTAPGDVPPEVAAAIAMALDQEQNGEVYAAIAMALHLYQTETVHDTESFILTIRHTDGGNWTDKSFAFRHTPGRKKA